MSTLFPLANKQRVSISLLHKPTFVQQFITFDNCSSLLVFVSFDWGSCETDDEVKDFNFWLYVSYFDQWE